MLPVSETDGNEVLKSWGISEDETKAVFLVCNSNRDENEYGSKYWVFDLTGISSELASEDDLDVGDVRVSNEKAEYKLAGQGNWIVAMDFTE